MRKSEAKEIARNILQDLIAQAGYKLYEAEEYEDYSKDEKDLIKPMKDIYSMYYDIRGKKLWEN